MYFYSSVSHVCSVSFSRRKGAADWPICGYFYTPSRERLETELSESRKINFPGLQKTRKT